MPHVAAMGVRALLEERYNFDTIAWLVLAAALAVPLSLWVQAQQRLRGPCPPAPSLPMSLPGNPVCHAV